MTSRELRFAFVVDDYEVTVRLFRDVLGLEVIEDFEEQEGRGVLMAVPAATVEILDRDHGDWVDRIETGRSLGERVRIAVRVDALRTAADAVRRQAPRSSPGRSSRPGAITTSDPRSLARCS
jgi:catechol 2,3-dioxygenase-like lactoylglutathione lyase family enzyme